MKKLIFSFIIMLLAIPNLSLAENNSNDEVCITLAYPEPIVVATSNTDQGINLSWDKIDDSRLIGYKVVISRDNDEPIYPADGYLAWLTDTNTTSYEIDNSKAYRNGDFGSYLDNDEEYYFSITAVYDCGGTRTSIAGNVLKLKFQEGVEDDGEDDDIDDNDEDDDTSNVAPATPEVTISSSDAGILVSWKKIDDNRFNGYKVVASKSKSKPVYPADGYLKYITDDDTTSYLINNSSAYHNGDFGSFFKDGEEYHFSITALYSTDKIAGNAISATYNGPAYEAKPEKYIDPIVNMEKKAQLLRANGLGDILAELKELRDVVKEQQNEIKYLKTLMADFKNIAQNVQDSLNNFITYGVDENTQKLGAGERAAVIHSFKSAFNKLPETDDEMADAIKIANGRWPAMTNEAAEHRAKIEFKKIYLRDADMNQANDNAAVTVMTYGLRQKAENRNLDSEREGIKTFKYIYGSTPDSTEDWNIMQAITYSGATR
jgi:hypothetical protein